jgi:uncharacterized delta-60 repeat protein/uncharacterized repeat protein (TIGR01451 family)
MIEMNVKNLYLRSTKFQFGARPRRFVRRATAILTAGLFVAASLMTPVKAAPGDLDPSFGSGGVVTTDISAFGSEAHSLAIQADGKIVAAGSSATPTNQQFALARYNPDGSLDQAFGSAGQVTTSFPGQGQASSLAQAVAIQPDGKIVAGGLTGFPSSCASCFLPQPFALARYDTDGTLDASFGSGGLVTLSLPLPSGINALAVQPDGRIVAGGFTFEPLPSVSTTGEFALIRLNPDGSPDPSFGSQGVVLKDFGQNSATILAVALQTDGRIVASGAVSNIPGFCVVRYNTDGSLDSSFGVGGIVTTPIQVTGFQAWGLSILSDGRILVGGGSTTAELARYNTDGSLDSTFGAGGIALAPFPGTYIAVMPSSDIIVAGTYFVPLFGISAFSVTRFHADGSLDPTFGTGGNVKTETPLLQNPAASAVVLYGNDKVVVGGTASAIFTPTFGFGLARYLADSGGGGFGADLRVTMSPSLSQDANGNSLITYTIAVANNGPDSSYYVTLSDEVPPGTVFESLTVPPGWVAYSEPAAGGTGPISVSTSQLLSGRSTDPAIFTLVVRVTQHHRAIPNHVSVSSSFTVDPNGSNNQAHTVTRVP